MDEITAQLLVIQRGLHGINGLRLLMKKLEEKGVLTSQEITEMERESKVLTENHMGVLGHPYIDFQDK